MTTTRKIADTELPDGWRMVRLDAVAEAIMKANLRPASTVVTYWMTILMPLGPGLPNFRVRETLSSKAACSQHHQNGA